MKLVCSVICPSQQRIVKPTHKCQFVRVERNISNIPLSSTEITLKVSLASPSKSATNEFVIASHVAPTGNLLIKERTQSKQERSNAASQIRSVRRKSHKEIAVVAIKIYDKNLASDETSQTGCGP